MLNRVPEQNRRTNPPEETKVSDTRRSRRLLALLLLVGVVFLASLPWQIQQWQKTQRLREINAAREAQLHTIEKEQADLHAAQSRLSGAPQGDLNARIDAANALIAHGDLDSAGKLLSEVEKAALTDSAQANDAVLASSLAGLFQRAGWMDRALANAERGVALAPDNAETLIPLALIEAQLGWQKECHAHVDAALKLAPQSTDAHLALALLHDQMGDYAHSEQELIAGSRARPDDMHIALLLFRNRMGQHQYDKALQAAENVLQTHPNDPDFLSARAEALIERGLSKPLSAGRADLEAGIEGARHLLQITSESNAHFLIGKALRGMGDEVGALREWKIAYASYPGQDKLALNMGQLMMRHGEADEGKRLLTLGETAQAGSSEYNRLVTSAGSDRHNSEKHRLLARWCQAHKRFSRAILEWEQVLLLRPTDEEAKREHEICLAARQQKASPAAMPASPIPNP